MNNRGAAGAADERVGNEVVTQRKRVNYIGCESNPGKAMAGATG